MINNSEFAGRLNKLMDHYQLSASAFADRIQVQRSSISHLLSGRNKPSLDFVLKVVKEFDEVELYWLLNGKGTFPAETGSAPIPKTDQRPAAKPDRSLAFDKEIIAAHDQAKKLERIVLFFDDGTFIEYIK